VFLRTSQKILKKTIMSNISVSDHIAQLLNESQQRGRSASRLPSRRVSNYPRLPQSISRSRSRSRSRSPVHSRSSSPVSQHVSFDEESVNRNNNSNSNNGRNYIQGNIDSRSIASGNTHNTQVTDADLIADSDFKIYDDDNYNDNDNLEVKSNRRGKKRKKYRKKRNYNYNEDSDDQDNQDDQDYQDDNDIQDSIQLPKHISDQLKSNEVLYSLYSFIREVAGSNRMMRKPLYRTENQAFRELWILDENAPEYDRQIQDESDEPIDDSNFMSKWKHYVTGTCRSAVEQVLQFIITNNKRAFLNTSLYDILQEDKLRPAFVKLTSFFIYTSSNPQEWVAVAREAVREIII
jgi:hypothetical protein